MKKIRFLIGSILASLALSACSNGNGGGNYVPPEPEEESNVVDLFVMSGQSNMEGSTYAYEMKNGTKKDYLTEYLESQGMSSDNIYEGIENIKTSFYGFYYPNRWSNAHTSYELTDEEKEDESKKSNYLHRLKANFLPTSVDMGAGDRVNGKLMGPEVGLANTLNEAGAKNVYLAKCAFSGSGFEKTDGPNWKTRNENENSLFWLLKTNIHNVIEAIEAEGKTPVIKGFIWHQGESDSNNRNYKTQMLTLLDDFGTEFEDYAPNGDKENIAFLDCTIYDGNRMGYGGVDTLNATKMEIANEADNRWCINASTKPNSGGMNLVIGGNAGDIDGCYSTYHYITESCYRLGEAWANIILENNLLG